MRRYAVRVLSVVENAILTQARFIAKDKPSAAAARLERLWDVMEGLAEFPDRHPVSRLESEALGVEIRKLVFGDYNVFYCVDHDRHTVGVVRFRHSASLTPASPN